MAVEDLPPLREVIKSHGLSAQKSFGQNFLLDLNLTRKIARAAGVGPQDKVIEIGPGPGGLTRALLLEGAGHVIAYEKDERCVNALNPLKEAVQGRLDVRLEDALETRFPPGKVVANLPYNISTPILLKLLRQGTHFQSLTLMFQKEVAQRLVAQPATKAYGRLSVIAQSLCDVRMLFDIPPTAFVPAPKVTSTVVQLTPKETDVNLVKLEQLTAAAFGQRRKMLKSSLKSIFPDPQTVLEQCHIRTDVRAEALQIEDFLALSKSL